MAHRQETTPDGEVLFTRERDVQARGNSSSLYHNIPKEARDLMGIEKGDAVEIDIRNNGYTVTVVDQ